MLPYLKDPPRIVMDPDLLKPNLVRLVFKSTNKNGEISAKTHGPGICVDQPVTYISVAACFLVSTQLPTIPSIYKFQDP